MNKISNCFAQTIKLQTQQKVNSLPPLGFEPVILGMLAHLSNHSAKSHLKVNYWIFLHTQVCHESKKQSHDRCRPKSRRMAVCVIF
jgi:hypothetical protein